MRSFAEYSIAKVSPEIVWIVDLDAEKSVTNDAERVCEDLHYRYPGRRIIYRDTSGDWDELVHDAGVFRGFMPARNLAP